MNYYIDYDGNPVGPFDLLGIIRKIRNGSLEKGHSVLSDKQETPKPAYQHPELYDIFVEQDRFEKEHEGEYDKVKSLGGLLKNSFNFLIDDQNSLILTGLLLLVMGGISTALAKGAPLVAASLLAPFLSYLCFQVFLICMLRLSRVQLLSFRYVGNTLKKHWPALLLAALPPSLFALTLPWLSTAILGHAGWGLVGVIGLPVMAYFLCIPLIITDRNLGFKEAFAVNHKTIKSLGLNGFMILIGLLVLIAISLPLIILALFAVPISILALCELYDGHFNGYH